MIIKKMDNYHKNYHKKDLYRWHKNHLLLVNIFFIVFVLIITIAVSKRLQYIIYEYLFKYFYDFEFKNFFSSSFFLFIYNNHDFSKFLNIFDSYQQYIYSFWFFFTFEFIYLIINYLVIKKKMEQYILAYGTFENNDFKNVINKLCNLKSLILSFGIMIFVCFLNAGIATWMALEKNYSLKANFFFQICIFSLLFYAGVVLYFWLNSYQYFYNYFVNYQKNNKLKNTKKIIKINTGNFIKNIIFYIFLWIIVIFNMPIDLIVIFFLFRYIPWKSFKLKKPLS